MILRSPNRVPGGISPRRRSVGLSGQPPDRAQRPASCKWHTGPRNWRTERKERTSHTSHTSRRSRRTRRCRTYRRSHTCRRCRTVRPRRVRPPPRYAGGNGRTTSRASIGSRWRQSVARLKSSTPRTSSWLASFQSAGRHRRVRFRTGGHRGAGAWGTGSGRLAGSGAGSAIGDRRRALLARRPAAHAVPAVASGQAAPHHPENYQDQ
jgi:hypothetical protein